MRDRHFMEDENELPYLVSETRDGGRNGGVASQKMDFDNVPYTVFPSRMRRLNMNQYHIDNIINSVEINARNCIVSMHKRDDEIIMTFLVENEYVATEFRLLYDLNFSQIEYLGGTTYHDNLKSRTWFINAVKKIEKENGYRYAFCFGGHDFSFSNGRLVVNGDFKSKVMFEKDGCSDHFDYNIDFAKRKLEFNHVCPFHEFYEFFC